MITRVEVPVCPKVTVIVTVNTAAATKVSKKVHQYDIVNFVKTYPCALTFFYSLPQVDPAWEHAVRRRRL